MEHPGGSGGVLRLATLLPPLLNPDALRETIARGVREGKFAYVVYSEDGRARAILQDADFTADRLEFSEEVLLLLPEQLSPPPTSCLEQPKENVEGQLSPVSLTETSPIVPAGVRPVVLPQIAGLADHMGREPAATPMDQFYMKILTHFATELRLRIVVRLKVAPERSISKDKVEEIRSEWRSRTAPTPTSS